jgi:beta-lactamase regulating signal transducer with metallopeptidase domain
MSAFLAAMLNGWWQGIILTLLVWLVLRDLPRISAATRLAIWHVTLLVVLLLPALQRIPLPEWRTREVPRAETGSAAPEPTAAVLAPVVPTLTQPVIELEEDHGGPLFVVIPLALAAIQLLRLVIGYWIVRRLKRKAALAGLELPVPIARHVQVLVSDRIGMPMAIGYRRPAIVLPRTLAENLTPEQLRHVLLHESAHLLRKDDWMALAERLLRAIFFFQPAVHWIGRRIEHEREMACDDWVIAQSAGEPKPYASSLARLAELGSSRRAPLLATGAGKPKAIFSRLETLLDRTRNRLPAVSEPLVMLAGLAILLAVYQGSHFNHLFGFSNYSSRWIESNGNNRREIKMRGDIRFARNDQDVESMSPGAKLLIEQSDGWRKRAVDFEADDTGAIQRRYFSDGIQRPFDTEARRFLARILPPWVREQGIDIPERLARMLSDKGADGALEDIRTIGRTDVKRRYLEELFTQTAPTAWQMTRALRIAGEMGSDYDKRRFLENVRDRLADRGLDMQVLAYIDSINSDDDRRQLFSYAIERSTFGDPAAPRLLRSVGRINSDQTKTELLRKVAQSSKARLPEAFFETAASINSDGDRERLLSAVLSLHGDDPATVAQALRTAASINSDGDKAKVVVAATRGFRGSQDTLREASRVLSSIHSDGDRRRCLEALIEADGRNADTLREVLLQAMSMNSDGDKTHVLVRAAAGFMEQEPVRRAFFSAANSIHSSGDHRRVLMAVLQRPGLEAETMREVARSASQISSNEDQGAVLKAMAERR